MQKRSENAQDCEEKPQPDQRTRSDQNDGVGKHRVEDIRRCRAECDPNAEFPCSTRGRVG